MQFQRKTKSFGLSSLSKIIIKFLFIITILFIIIILIDKINFPAPEKSIEKIIPNENFKIIK
tara:strand:+ start:773 stop:958 length:186 start_codon:yes stop_codon:yes gene_type:complete